MRPLTLMTIVCITLGNLAVFRADSPANESANQERVTLLGTLEDWKYPGAKMPEGATMSDGGNPTLQSVKCQTILTTSDSIEKVIDFYSKKFGISAETGNVAQSGEGRSILVQGDSKGRPVKVHVIAVHKADTSTTLVISREASEKETHIAWLHYMRLGDARRNK